MAHYRWYKISGDESQVPLATNGIATVEVEGKKFCITRYKDHWYAFSHTCPHASGPLGAGYVDMIGNIVCPLHHYKFSIFNGRNTSGEGFFLRTYPVESRSDGLYIGLDQAGFDLRTIHPTDYD